VTATRPHFVRRQLAATIACWSMTSKAARSKGATNLTMSSIMLALEEEDALLVLLSPTIMTASAHNI
jgi:hypothetical protein